MTAKDYLTLPDRIDNFIEVHFDEKLKTDYKDFKRKKLLELRDTNEQLFVPTAVALVNKLLQYANGVIYDENKNCHYLHDLKLDALEEILEASNGKPLLVAWTYRSDRERIMKRFAAYNPRDLQTPQDIADWNAGRIGLMLAHPASAGHGLNLQAGGNIIVWYGLTYSLEQYLQFNARLHRQGQTEKVIVHHIVAVDTIDKEVVETLRNKKNLQDSLMESLKVEAEKLK
jgi:SNF2 family DNA or RNA helicase